jgi:hypothetical protein
MYLCAEHLLQITLDVGFAEGRGEIPDFVVLFGGDRDSGFAFAMQVLTDGTSSVFVNNIHDMLLGLCFRDYSL